MGGELLEIGRSVMTPFYWEANYGTGELRIFACRVDFAGIIPITALVAMEISWGLAGGVPGGGKVAARV